MSQLLARTANTSTSAKILYPGGYFQYNKDPNNQIYAIRRYEFESGELTDVTGGPGGSCRQFLLT